MWIPWPSAWSSATAGVAPAVSAVSRSASVTTAVAVDPPVDSPVDAPTLSPAGSPADSPASSAPPVYLRCHQSSRASTTGISAKLYAGGGDGIDHSSVRASHGSLPATGPRLVE